MARFLAQWSATLVGSRSRSRRLLLSSTALQAAVLLIVALPAAAQLPPTARPQGGQVVAGTASISQSAQLTQVTQATSRAALDWRSFDVGSSHTVAFAQPSASAVTLNRVTGPDPSTIAGRITANGQVVLINQSGVVFTPGAQVDAQSLVVSAPSMSQSGMRSFVAGTAGRMVFDQPARPNARIVNEGAITVKQAGLAAMVAPQVANRGTIKAKLGHVVLAGAETHTLDLYGDGLVSIDVTGEVRQTPKGRDGKPVTALVTNSGTIAADGGTVLLTAAAADGIVQESGDSWRHDFGEQHRHEDGHDRAARNWRNARRRGNPVGDGRGAGHDGRPGRDRGPRGCAVGLGRTGRCVRHGWRRPSGTRDDARAGGGRTFREASRDRAADRDRERGRCGRRRHREGQRRARDGTEHGHDRASWEDYRAAGRRAGMVAPSSYPARAASCSTDRSTCPPRVARWGPSRSTLGTSPSETIRPIMG